MNTWKKLLEHNSAILIQRFVRNIGLRQRNLMFINILDYIKKNMGSSQLIISMKDIMNLNQQYHYNQHSINFGFMDQKISFGINKDN